MNRTLEGRAAIITGASQGLGLAIARAYVDAGSNVFLCAREAAPLKTAVSELSGRAGKGQKVLGEPADVSQEPDVNRIVAHAADAFGQVQILVNNAGIYGPKGLVEENDFTEWVRAFEINLFGSVRMCRVLLPHFKTHRYGKIVQLSGGGATKPLPHLSAYAASKAAVVRFIETLAEEVREMNIDANAIAPGFLNTRLLDEVLDAGPEKVGDGFHRQALEQKAKGGTPLDHGAKLAVYLGSAASDGITGKLLAAVWDPWPTLADHFDELRRTDIYTLRRIVPKDRGATWGD